MKQKKKKRKKEIRQKKEVKDRLIKDITITEIKTLFEQQQQEEDYYYKPKIESNFHINNYIEYESNGDRNRNLSLSSL